MMQLEGSTDFRDRKGWLVFFGIVEILMGFVCLLFLGAMLLASSNIAASTEALPLKGLISAMFMYGLFSVFFITIGIGSILARRWARAIMVMFSGLWFVFGTVGILMMFTLLSQMFSSPAMNGEQLQPGVIVAAKVTIVVISIVLFVIVPGGLFFFYRSPNVKATCEKRDPRLRWTDRPLLVLSLSLVSGFIALSMVVSLYSSVVPFFGIILTGIPAMIYKVTFGAVAAWGAWHLYHQRMQGWLAIMGFSVFGIISWAVTVMRGGLPELYRVSGLTQEQLQQMSAVSEWQNSPSYWLALGVSALVWFGYLWLVRKELLALRSAL